MVLLVVNSLYWSVYVGSSVEIVAKATRQLEWLESQLELAKSYGLKVILAGHIPPGYVNKHQYCMIVQCTLYSYSATNKYNLQIFREGPLPSRVVSFSILYNTLQYITLH